MKTEAQRYYKRFKRTRNKILLKQTLTKKQFTKNKYAIFPDKLAMLRADYQTKKLARKYDSKPVRIIINGKLAESERIKNGTVKTNARAETETTGDRIEAPRQAV